MAASTSTGLKGLALDLHVKVQRGIEQNSKVKFYVKEKRKLAPIELWVLTASASTGLNDLAAGLVVKVQRGHTAR